MVLYFIVDMFVASAKARRTIVLILLTALVGSSCDIGTALLSEKELGSMYKVILSQNDATLNAGSRVDPAQPINLSITASDGAPDASAVDVVLYAPDGAEAATLSFTPAAGAKDVLGELPAIALPAGLPNNYYTMEITIKNAAGANLATSTTALLVYDQEPVTPKLFVYPGTITAGRVSLLKLQELPAGIDPWIRWSIDGIIKAEGPASQNTDRLAWRSSESGGVYVARAEVFPFKPPLGLQVSAPFRVEVKLPVPAPALRQSATAPMAAWSHFELDDSLADTGARLQALTQAAKPQIMGQPYLEAYSSGFGYVLGDGSGITSTTSLLPAEALSDGIGECTISFTVAPVSGKFPRGSSRLFTSMSETGSESLVVDVLDGYVGVRSGGNRVASKTQLPSRAVRIAIHLAPGRRRSESALITIYVDNEQIAQGSLPTDLFGARAAASTIAGSDGFKAIYDDVSILPGPYPAFFLAEEARLGQALVAATAFEGGVAGQGFELSTGTVLSDGQLGLDSGATCSVGQGGMPAGGSILTLEIRSGLVSVWLNMADGSILTIDSTGVARVGQRLLAAAIPGITLSRMVVALEETDNGVTLYGIDGEIARVPAKPAADARWIIAATGGRNAVISRITASTFQPSLLSADRKPDASSVTLLEPSGELAMAYAGR